MWDATFKTQNVHDEEVQLWTNEATHSPLSLRGVLYGKPNKTSEALTSANQSKTVSNFLSEFSDSWHQCARSLKTLEKKKKKTQFRKSGPEMEIKEVKPSMKTGICQLYREPPNSICLINMTMEIALSVLCRLLISLSLPAGFVCFLKSSDLELLSVSPRAVWRDAPLQRGI